MKKIFLLASLALTMVTSALAQSPTAALLPMPNKVTILEKEKPFPILKNGITVYATDKTLDFATQTLSGMLAETFGTEATLAKQAKGADVILSIDASLEGNEHYQLNVNRKGICIKGATQQLCSMVYRRSTK